MKNALIKISKKQIVDTNTTEQPFQDIFNDTFKELEIQLRNLGGGFMTWKQVLNTQGQPTINQLKNQVAIAARHNINSLKNIIPYLTNTSGTIQIPFEHCHFDILQSELTDRKTHKIILTYQTSELTLIDSVNDKLLLALGDKTANISENKVIDTFMLEISQPDIEIRYYQRF